MYITEIFSSIQGEGKYTGYPTTFVRLFGCNLFEMSPSYACKYCDEKHSMTGKRIKMHLGLVMDKIGALENKYVCITGGEPLMQEETMPLVYELLYNDYIVTVETNGTIPIEHCEYARSYSYCMDVKLPSSRTVLAPDLNCYKNLGELKANDEVKFVISNIHDYEEAKRILKKYKTKASLIFSPVNCDLELAREIMGWLMKDKLKAKLGLQIHKLLEIK